MNSTYLNWVIENTPTKWWHDSAESSELDLGLERGAIGVTTNPFLANIAVNRNRSLWARPSRTSCRATSPGRTGRSAHEYRGDQSRRETDARFESSKGQAGFVCAQVNPVRAGDRDCMYAMAKRFHAWAPNIAVKLPATAAGLDVLEDCVAEGITITATVSFTVPQVLAIAERHRAGVERAKKAASSRANVSP